MISNGNQFVCFSFTCTSGFFLNGEPTSTCEDDEDGDALGVWSSLAPVCVAITCNPPRTSPDNGQVTCSNRNFLNSQCRCVTALYCKIKSKSRKF